MKIKSLSKDEQSRIKKRFQELFDHLDRLVPDLLDSSFLCPIESYRKKLMKMSEKGDFSYSGSDSFLSAISETYSAMQSDIPLMGVLKTPYGSLSYVKRGNTDDRVIAGVQNWDNDTWRMLAFYNLVMSRNIRIFSSANYYLASCKNTPPPVEFVEDVLNEEGIRFEAQGRIINIGKQDPSFSITIMSSVVLNVFSDSRYRTGFSLLRHMLLKDTEADIAVDSGMLPCAGPDDPDLKRRYLAGEIDDRHMVDMIAAGRRSRIVKSGRYAIGYSCYDGMESFLSAIDGSEEYAEFLKKYQYGIYLETPSLAKLMEIVWPSLGQEISEARIGRYAKSFSEMLSARSQLEGDRGVGFEAWSEDSQFLVDLIRTYRASGVQAAVMIMRDRAKNHIQRAMLYAFTMCVGGTSVGYIFDEDDRKLGAEIAGYVRSLAMSENLEENLARIRAYVP
ncbi:hypothetical protein [Thermoplasma acidophilum]|uniref:Uncharacterized protein n=1 Tax=Thermoplasma acidophilum (strain ATCC 25905 / DSM 1728 / JCM 9062 / NBRC 15155 / AMRC-C165) TaxID=273075 RepID=Q9HIB7_THEAC|nr:hypothetical protein [Thermoplasma acidophilum]CAC12544.1 hypothetical protein [Thermoplasma acidophilum]